ncbi:hypothetical protein DVT68_17310 [Dyella solisilvae]|uniref:Uncharacterized protein n=1 Tax=Dyella solisilvae TaxID=1920168 RepID=A0A370K4Z5_9GAMM|nr:hypothetical protein [Dyella solisilvae]RDI97497.1 hypothetical protein DVT68_17310 [Dyella solisilvae]
MKRRMFLSLALASSSLWVTSPLRAAKTTQARSLIRAAPPFRTAKDVADAVDRRGARAFLMSLSAEDTEFLYERIGLGGPDWVALAPRLAPGADGADAEGLSIELAHALPRNAAAVLKVLDPIEGDDRILATSRVCSIPFIEGVPHNYKIMARRALSQVRDPTLQAAKRRCLAVLNQS